MNENGTNNVAHGTRAVVLGHGGGAICGVKRRLASFLAPSWISHPAVVVVVHGAGDTVAGCVNAHIAERGSMTTTTTMWNMGVVDDVECGHCQ